MKQTKSTKVDRAKFDREIDGFKKVWQEYVKTDLSYLDDIPNFTGKDEPIPFPYGSGDRGEDFGQWNTPAPDPESPT